MIIAAEIINQPYSGQFDERIYDNESLWNSQSWTWIKFTNDDFIDWCGQFRGFPRQIAISTVYNTVLVLTSDYLFQLDRATGNLIELDGQPQFQNLTVTPDGSYILADYYYFEKVTTSISKRTKIDSPIQMDIIEFKGWSNGKLEFSCDEFLNWDRHLTMLYDFATNKIEFKNAT
jgi:hypothetical protein